MCLYCEPVDKWAFGAVESLHMFTSLGEMTTNDAYILEYVQDYEAKLCMNISVYGCFNHHGAYAFAFAKCLCDSNVLSADTVSSLNDLLPYFSYNITEWLPRYGRLNDRMLVGPSIVLLSLEAMRTRGVVVATTVRAIHSEAAYKLASLMARDLSKTPVSSESQEALIGVFFASCGLWTSACVTRANLRRTHFRINCMRFRSTHQEARV